MPAFRCPAAPGAASASAPFRAWCRRLDRPTCRAAISPAAAPTRSMPAAGPHVALEASRGDAALRALHPPRRDRRRRAANGGGRARMSAAAILPDDAGPLVEARDVSCTFRVSAGMLKPKRPLHAVDRRDPLHPARRGAGPRRRVRLRQDHARAHAARPARAVGRRDPHRRQVDRARSRAAQIAAPRAARLPGPLFLAQPAQVGRLDHRRCRCACSAIGEAQTWRARVEDDDGAGRPRPRPLRQLSRASSPAASASASPSPARSSTARASSSATSRPRRSTSRCSRRS